MVILTDASDSTRSAGLISSLNLCPRLRNGEEEKTTAVATEITEDTERKESRGKKFFCVRVVNRFFSVPSVAIDSVRSDFRALAGWPKTRKNARPKSDTSPPHENLI